MLERPVFILLRALRNMRQNPVLCGAAIGTVAVSLTIVAFFSLMVLNIQDLTRHWSREIQVVIYLDRVPEENQLRGWIDQIRGRPEVEGVTFVSRGAAFERFRGRLQQDADLLDGLGPDFLPGSLEIALTEHHRNRQGVEALAAALKRSPQFSDLRYGQDWLERFESFLRLVKAGGLLLGGFLFFATLFIVANTIKLTLYARRDELEVMALVGATPLFIQFPFLVEGALQGAAGGLLAIGGAYALHQLLLRQGLEAVLLAAGTHFLPPLYLAAIVALGTLLGFFGSLLSLRRFTRI